MTSLNISFYPTNSKNPKDIELEKSIKSSHWRWNQQTFWVLDWKMKQKCLQIAYFVQLQPKYIKVSVINDQEKHHILTFETLEPENIEHFSLKSD